MVSTLTSEQPALSTQPGTHGTMNAEHGGPLKVWFLVLVLFLDNFSIESL